MSSVRSAIKYVNIKGQPQTISHPHGRAQPTAQARQGQTGAPRGGERARPARAARPLVAPAPVSERARPASASRPLVAPAPVSEPSRMARAFEEGRRAFHELSGIHATKCTELEAAHKRLARAEQDLRQERERSTRYAEQIASQEKEMRQLKIGKRAADELNSKLSARLASSQKPREPAQPARRNAGLDEQAAMERLVASEKNWRAESEALKQRVRSYSDMVTHAERAVGICAQLCAPLSAETSRDMLETQRTLRDFQASMRA